MTGPAPVLARVLLALAAVVASWAASRCRFIADRALWALLALFCALYVLADVILWW